MDSQSHLFDVDFAPIAFGDVLIGARAVAVRERALEIVSDQLDQFLARQFMESWWHARLSGLEIPVEGLADLRPSPMKKESLIGLGYAQNVANFLRGPSLDVAKGDHFALARRQGIDRGLGIGANFTCQKDLLGRRAPIAGLADPSARPFRVVFIELTGIDGG